MKNILILSILSTLFFTYSCKKKEGDKVSPVSLPTCVGDTCGSKINFDTLSWKSVYSTLNKLNETSGSSLSMASAKK